MGTAKEMTARVSAKGWIVIPAPLRRRYGIRPGSMVKIKEVDNRIVLVPEAMDPVKECFGKLSGKASLTRALLKEREEELRREEKKRIRT